MSRNPEYRFVNNDADKLLTNMISMYEQLTGYTVTPASPERLFISWVAHVLVQAFAQINYAANQNIPSRADGVNLDALAELVFMQKRPQPQKAICTEQFEISKPQLFDITVPAGTRVMDAQRTAYFETVEEATIPAGETTVSVVVRCMEAGAAGNGYVAGQLNNLVDRYPYHQSCTNLTASDGGADEATDEEFYALLRASMDAYSTAGPTGAYAYHAKSVSTEIADVRAVRPKRELGETLPVYDHHAFLASEGLHMESFEVNGGSPNVDYSLEVADGLISIELLESGSLYDMQTINVRGIIDYAGEVDIYALMEDGTPASGTIKDLILAACNDETVRPLTDKVTVKDLNIETYNINLTYYTSEDNTASASQVAAAVAAAVEEFKAWQSARIGRDINPSKLTQYVMSTGVVKRVVITAPTFKSLRDGSDHYKPDVARCGTTTITNGGVEDD